MMLSLQIIPHRLTGDRCYFTVSCRRMQRASVLPLSAASANLVPPCRSERISMTRYAITSSRSDSSIGFLCRMSSSLSAVNLLRHSFRLRIHGKCLCKAVLVRLCYAGDCLLFQNRKRLQFSSVIIL